MRYADTLGSRCAKMFTVVAGSIFLTQCSGEGIETFGFAEELSEHFGDMNYGAMVIDGPPTGDVGTRMVRGDGRLDRPDDSPLYFKWAFVVSDDRGLVGGYIGDSEMEATTTVFLTEGETRDALRRCSETHEEVDDLFACFDRVLDRVVSDCEFSMSVEECHMHCWYDSSKCRGG